MRARVSLAALAVFSCVLFPPVAGQETPKSRPAAPFQGGEALRYQIRWNPPWYLFFLPTMDAGEAELRLEEGIDPVHGKVLRIVFTARSSGALASLAGLEVNDRFEFMTDARTLCTIHAHKKIEEGKRKREIDVTYFPDCKWLHIHEVDLAEHPRVVKRDEFVPEVPACVKDLFSALYSIRRMDLGESFAAEVVVGDNAEVRRVQARVERRDSIRTPLGRFETWKLDTVALLGGLFKGGGQFHFWLTDDARKLPVRFEVKVKLGKVTGVLKSFRPQSAPGR